RGPVRQRCGQERAVALEGDACAGHDDVGLAHSLDCRAVQAAPELHRVWMRALPRLLAMLDFGVRRGVVVGRKLLPGADTTHVAEGQICGLADRARLLRRDAEGLA